MDSLVEVHHLRDAQVGGQRAKRVGILTGNAGMLADKRDHVAQRLFDGVVEILVKTHGDPGVRLLGARRRQLHVLAHMELEGAGERRLNRGQANLAVALYAMAVAGREQGAGSEDWEI